MDPEIHADARGNGSMVFYAYGRSWAADLFGWRVRTPVCTAVNGTLGPAAEPSPARVTNWAQLLVNRYFAGCSAAEAGA